MLASFTSDPVIIQRRLRARLTKAEFGALCLQFLLVAVFVWMHTIPTFPPYDYNNYVQTANGDFSFYYYAYWFVPVMHIFNVLPGDSGFVVWSILNILGVFFTARIFGGTAWVTLISYQMIYSVFYGQITGILVGGMGLFWWAMANRRWEWAGIGLLIACTKYQLGVPLCFAMWLLSDLTWRERFRLLVLPVVIGIASLIVYPLWFLDVLNNIRNNYPIDYASVSLWRWVGAFALLLWIPPLFMRLPRERRIIAIGAAASLALPYYQQADLPALYVLPIGWLPLLGNAGYLYPFLGWVSLQILWFVPLIAYVRALWFPWLPVIPKQQAVIPEPSEA